VGEFKIEEQKENEKKKEGMEKRSIVVLNLFLNLIILICLGHTQA
jgi:hypothetical protein